MRCTAKWQSDITLGAQRDGLPLAADTVAQLNALAAAALDAKVIKSPPFIFH